MNDTTLHAPACLDCLTLDVPVEEAGTEVPTCGPSASAPSAYTTEDRCGECGSERLTTDAIDFEVAVAESADVHLAGQVGRAARTLAVCRGNGPAVAEVRRTLASDLARMSPLARYVAAAALGVEL